MEGRLDDADMAQEVQEQEQFDDDSDGGGTHPGVDGAPPLFGSEQEGGEDSGLDQQQAVNAERDPAEESPSGGESDTDENRQFMELEQDVVNQIDESDPPRAAPAAASVLHVLLIQSQRTRLVEWGPPYMARESPNRRMTHPRAADAPPQRLRQMWRCAAVAAQPLSRKATL